MNVLRRIFRGALGRCDRVGARPRVDGGPFIHNGGRIEIGDDFYLSSRPVQSHLLAERGGVLEIGNSVAIGQGVAIAAHRHIRIGDRTRIGAMVVIADTDFHVAGDRTAEPQTSPVVIGADVRIGHRVTVLRGSVIGDGADIGAGSIVSGIVTPGSRVAGVPARAIGADSGERFAVDGTAVSVSRLIGRVLGLETGPSQEAGPDQLSGWDSLGALKILLALEDEFRISLREEDVGQARCVADLVRAVESAQAHHAA